MKMTKYVFLCVGLVLLSACSDHGLQVTEEHWQCEAKKCEASFTLTNGGQQTIIAHYAVRAQSAIQTIGSDLSKGFVVAEIKENVKLDAGQSQVIRHQFDAARPPTDVSVNAWVK